VNLSWRPISVKYKMSNIIINAIINLIAFTVDKPTDITCKTNAGYQSTNWFSLNEKKKKKKKKKKKAN